MRLFFSLLVCAVVLLPACNSPAPAVATFDGRTMGTTYRVTVPAGSAHLNTLQNSADSILNVVNASMSTYIGTSLISGINTSADTDEAHEVDDHFVAVFKKAREVYEKTAGAFNPALGPLISAWGFGAQDRREVSSETVDSLLKLVDFTGFTLIPPYSITKRMSKAQLDFSAIAKGYGVDAVAELIEAKGINAYFVEIGGEVRTRGQHPSGRAWRTGIDKPIAQTTDQVDREIQTVIELSNRSLATSGNYRNFYVRDGKKYVHTINPETGYPEENDLLSASVSAADCMTADAYATAFMVLGKDKALDLAQRLEGIEAYFVYADDAGNFQEVQTNGFPTTIKLNQ